MHHAHHFSWAFCKHQWLPYDSFWHGLKLNAVPVLGFGRIATNSEYLGAIPKQAPGLGTLVFIVGSPGGRY